MLILQAFIISFIFSYIGSIPPGSINLSVIQLSLSGQTKQAIRFSMAAAIVEFFYGIAAVIIQIFFLTILDITFHTKLIAGLAMLVLGIVNMLPKSKNSKRNYKIHKVSGFKKGLLISIFNPLAIPFWIAVTVYLKSQGWVTINKETFIFYILGISMGTFLLLATLIFIASKFKVSIENNVIVNKITGLVFLALSLYTFWTLI